MLACCQPAASGDGQSRNRHFDQVDGSACLLAASLAPCTRSRRALLAWSAGLAPHVCTIPFLSPPPRPPLQSLCVHTYEINVRASIVRECWPGGAPARLDVTFVRPGAPPATARCDLRPRSPDEGSAGPNGCYIRPPTGADGRPRWPVAGARVERFVWRGGAALEVHLEAGGGAAPACAGAGTGEAPAGGAGEESEATGSVVDEGEEGSSDDSGWESCDGGAAAAWAGAGAGGGTAVAAADEGAGEVQVFNVVSWRRGLRRPRASVALQRAWTWAAHA